MIPFLTAGYGPFYVMDCAEMNTDGEAPVYEVSTGGYTNGKDKLADSFGEFLRNEVRRTLAPRVARNSMTTRIRRRHVNSSANTGRIGQRTSSKSDA